MTLNRSDGLRSGLRTWAAVSLLAAAWYYCLSGLFFATAGSELMRRVDVLFSSDTAGWVGMVSGEHIHDFRRAKHPVCRELWIVPEIGLARLLGLFLPPAHASVVSTRIGTALVAGAGIGALALCALRRGWPPVRAAVLVVSGLFGSAQVLVCLPEHWGISAGLLALAWSVYLLDLSDTAKCRLLAVLTLLAGGTTTTNVAFPLLLLTDTVVRHRYPNMFTRLTRQQVVRVAGGALMAAGAAALLACLLGIGPGKLSLAYLHGRLVRDPRSAAIYAARGLVDPVVAPAPTMAEAPNLDDKSSGKWMLTFEPNEARWPYGAVATAAVAAWAVVFGWSAFAVVRTPALRAPGGVLGAWLLFNAVFHNVWGDEYFLFSPHWGWALTALVILGGRSMRPATFFALSAVLIVGQVNSLYVMNGQLVRIVSGDPSP